MKKTAILLAVLSVMLSIAFFAVSCQKNDRPDGNQIQFNLPAGALEGEFSVSATKKVHFSRGNLYYDGDSFEFETNQYDVQIGWWDFHVRHFFWSKDKDLARAQAFRKSDVTASDVFFTNATEETAKADFTVNGVTGKYRTLSKAEWKYLINKDGAENIRKGKYRYGVTVCTRTNCLVLAPDNFEGSIAASYDSDAWATAEADGLVCLPAAGYRDLCYVVQVGDSGNYVSSSANDEYSAYILSFGIDNLYPDGLAYRSYGGSVRLITESK